MNAIDIKKLSYSYLGNWLVSKKHAVIDVNVAVKEGEFFGFLGHNGAGKTTTIKCILGLLRQTEGEIKIFGESNENYLSRRAIGYVPEQPYFYDHLTAGELLKMFAALSLVSKNEIKDRIRTALARLKITDLENRKMRTLSKGQTQRIAIAQAILHNPRILILDEPFSGLDPLGRREIKDILFEEKKKGTTVFICTHIISDVESLCDRASIMVSGNIKGIFDIKEISNIKAERYEIIISGGEGVVKNKKNSLKDSVEEGALKIVYFQNKEEAELFLKEALLDTHCEVLSYQAERKGLEDIFLELVKYGNRNSTQHV